MKISAEIPRRAALAALLGIPAGLTLHHISKKLGLRCSPFPVPPHHETHTTQAEPPPLIHGPDASLPNLTLEQATGLIALHGLRITWATLRMFGACIVGQDDCIGGDIQSAIDDLQNDGFRSFHIYGSMTFDRMNEIRNALLDQSLPPLIVSIDQEGGIVSRLSWMPSLRFISAYMLRRSRDPLIAKEAGYITGQLLALNGINLNFAPFVDLHAYSPYRRFADNSQEIALYAGAFAQGLQAAGVGACAKHFPDGSAEQNAHQRLGRVSLARQELEVVERYQPLIKQGLSAIMVDHDIFMQVDPQNPASLSRRWITEILREEMGFNGLIVTDALGMGGLREVATYEEAILRAFKAGADLLLSSGPTARNVLMQAVARGEIAEERIFESARRIIEFSQRFPIAPPVANKAELEQPLMHQAEDLYRRLTIAAQ